MNYNIIKYHRQIQITSRVPGIQTYAGPGDVITTTAVSWWGLRAYSDATVGRNSVKLRRSSDNATQSFQTLDNGSVDIASITAFKGAADLFVDTLYDQVGNTHLFQGTVANQPTFILNGQGVLPVMRFSGAQNLTADGPLHSQPYTFSWAAKRTGNFSAHSTVISSLSSSSGFDVADSVYIFCSGSISADVAATDNVFHCVDAVFNTTASDLNVDGTSNVVTQANTDTNGTMTFGSGFGGVNFVTGDILQAGIWFAALTPSQSSAINGNTRAYWGY